MKPIYIWEEKDLVEVHEAREALANMFGKGLTWPPTATSRVNIGLLDERIEQVNKLITAADRLRVAYVILKNKARKELYR